MIIASIFSKKDHLMIKSYDVSASFNNVEELDETEFMSLVWGYAVSDGYVKKSDIHLYDIKIVEA